ncbi:hypothetical protein ACSQ67_009286 [Phaseolus vulgaris]
MSVELKLSRSNRIYRPSEALEGKIVVKTQSSISHYGIRLTLKGSVALQVRGGSAGVVESFYGVIKPIPIVNRTIEVKSSGKIGLGTSEYLVTVDIPRGYLHKSLSATMEFIVESDKADLLQRPLSPEMVIFYITQDTQRHPLLPEIKSGMSIYLQFQSHEKTDRNKTKIAQFGELTVEASAVPIQSIDIQLFRVESILLGEKIIADGDVCRHLTLPIYVILPRLVTCPTILAGPFSIEFKVAIVISFQSELSKLHKKSDPKTPRLWVGAQLAMETLPLELVRTK